MRDATVGISLGTRGTLSYTWNNTAGKVEFLDVSGEFCDRAAPAVAKGGYFRIPLPSDPLGGPEIIHTGTAALDKTFGSHSFGVGSRSLQKLCPADKEVTNGKHEQQNSKAYQVSSFSRLWKNL